MSFNDLLATGQSAIILAKYGSLTPPSVGDVYGEVIEQLRQRFFATFTEEGNDHQQNQVKNPSNREHENFHNFIEMCNLKIHTTPSYRAAAYSRLEQYDLAIQDFRFSKKHKFGKSYFVHTEAAIQAFKKSLNTITTPLSAPNVEHVERANALKEERNERVKALKFNDAIMMYNKVMKESQDFCIRATCRLEQYDLAIEDAHITIDGFFGQMCQLKSEPLIEEGNELLKASKFDDAVEKYSEAIKLYRDPAYFCYRAAAYCNLKQYDLAINDCNSALELDDKFAKAYGRMGLVHYYQNRFVASLEAHEAALALDPLYMLGENYGNYLTVIEEKFIKVKSLFNNLLGGSGGVADFKAFVNDVFLQQVAKELMSHADIQSKIKLMLEKWTHDGGDEYLQIVGVGKNMAQNLEHDNIQLLKQIRQIFSLVMYGKKGIKNVQSKKNVKDQVHSEKSKKLSKKKDNGQCNDKKEPQIIIPPFIQKGLLVFGSQVKIIFSEHGDPKLEYAGRLYFRHDCAQNKTPIAVYRCQFSGRSCSAFIEAEMKENQRVAAFAPLSYNLIHECGDVTRDRRGGAVQNAGNAYMQTDLL